MVLYLTWVIFTWWGHILRVCVYGIIFDLGNIYLVGTYFTGIPGCIYLSFQIHSMGFQGATPGVYSVSRVPLQGCTQCPGCQSRGCYLLFCVPLQGFLLYVLLKILHSTLNNCRDAIRYHGVRFLLLSSITKII
jgi:hypothetical protein